MHKIVLFTTFFFTALSSFAKQSSTCAFIENKGQIIDQNNQPNPSVKYLWNGGGMKLQLRENAFSYEVLLSEKLHRRNTLSGSMFRNKIIASLDDSIVYHSHRVDVSLVNANPHPELVAEQVQPEVLNYYTTGTPEEGVANVHQYGKVTYKEIYPNIDLEFISSDDATHPFKYNFIVHSGGEVKDIRLHYEGATATTLRYGNITIGTANGDLKEAIPTSYVMENGKDVTVQYLSIGNDTYGFQAEKYPAYQTLVIDPWATYFGLPTNSTPGGLSVDRESNIVTVGLTTQSTNVATTGAHQTSYGGNSDAYVRKWSPTGFPIWCTYYGGSGQDGGGIPGHDSLGNIYFIGGTQSSSGIATPGSFIDTYSPSAGTNTFVAKLNTNGIRIWASYLNFEIYTMKIDHAANIIISGFAQVNGLATTGAHQTNLAGGTDDFLMKLNSNGIRLWATYYGGSDEELNSASIDVDNNNNIYLCGLTQSSNNIASLGAFQTVYGGGGGDVFFAKFNSAGVRQWGTYYGGNSNEDLTSNIAVDPFGNIYVTGKGATANFFATPGAFQMNLGGIDQDCFLSKFSGSGQRIWSTYFGGSKEDQVMSLTTDKQGNAIFSGYTLSSDIIATPGAFQDTFGGVSINSNSYDGFIEKFSPIGTRLWGTYLGSGDADDYISGITSGNNNEVIFTAIVTRPGIASSGAYCTTLSPNTSDGYLASFDSTGKLTTPVPELSGSSASIIQVYPNPAKDLVQVSLPSLAQGTLTISDAMGKVVKSVVVKSQEMTIDIKDLPAGVYLLQYDDGEVCETLKVVKE